jgi:fatty-acyl-CoA synthase
MNVVEHRDRSVGALLEILARESPEGMALAFPDRGFRQTFAQLENRVSGIAQGLILQGLRPGDRVALLGGNVPDWPVAQLAVARAGAILVPINARLAPPEMEYIISHSQASFLITTPTLRHGDGDPLSALSGLAKVFVMDAPDDSYACLDEIIAPREDFPRAGLDDPALIIYTSGTTGRPKGVMLSHRNVVNNAHALAHGLGFSPTDRLCTTFPFFHVAGCVMSVLGCLSHGACLVATDQPGPLPILKTLEAQRCTALFGVATMFSDILEHPRFGEFDLSSLRTGTMGGATCPEPLLRRLITEMKLTEMTVSYGLTETSPIITLTGRFDPLESRTQTVGRAIADVAIKIVDPATRQEVPLNTPGELATRSPYVMLGYYRQPEATERCIDAQGWFYTGDQACQDKDGNIRITGRINDIIIRAGENISPASVEEVLRCHPSVLDACVYGLPDIRLGERVAAAIRLRPGCSAPDLEEIEAFCQGKLAYFKIPQQLSVMESFPATASGKVQRFVLQSLGAK